MTKQSRSATTSAPAAGGYSGTPLARKLGIKPGSRVLAAHAPAHYAELLAPLPEGVAFDVDAGQADLVHCFVRERSALVDALQRLRNDMRADAALWISWPKRSSGQSSDISEDVIRSEALPLGWVDVKVCAIDATWSALKLVVRKALR